jgi:hypothetical protein
MFRATSCSLSEESVYLYNIWYVSLCVGGRLVCRCSCSSSGESVYLYNIWYVSLCVGDRLVCRCSCSSSGESVYLYNIWYVSLCVGGRLVCRCSRSSSGESIISIQHLVCVTLCRWPSSVQFPTCILDSHLHKLTHTRCCFNPALVP